MASYGTSGGVASRVPAADISATGTPSTAEVTAWLEEGYSIINRALAGAGYSAPVATSAAVYAELAGLNELYAAAMVRRSLGLDTVTGETERRSENWFDDFYRRLGMLVEDNLAVSGVSRLPASTPTRRKRIRTLQLRRVDGYSRAYEDIDDLPDYASE